MRQFHFDEEEIFNITQNYKKYETYNLKLKGLRKFDDCEPYGISEASHIKLLRKEIRKLVATASSEEPHLFHEGGHIKGVTAEDFQDVSNVLDQIHSNLAIVRHDTEQIAVEKPWGMSLPTAIEEFKDTRTLLLSRYDVDEDFIEGSQPVLLHPPSRNKEVYHALVDYLLGAVARLWVRSAVSKYWETHMFAVLAAWAVKLKVVAYDPTKAAETSLTNGEDIMDQVVGGGGTKQPLRLKIRIGEGRDAHDREFSTLNEKDDIVGRYYREKILIRRGLEPLFLSALKAMYDRNKFRETGPIESFESCQLIYKTGLDGVTTTLNSDRFGCIHCSCEPAHINFMYSAMLLLMQILDAIQARKDLQSPPSQEDNSESKTRMTGATLTWKFHGRPGGSKSSEGSIQLSHMDDIISIAVGQCMSTVYTAAAVEDAIRVVSSGTTEEDPVMQFAAPPKAFQAMFHLRTEEFIRRQLSLANSHTQSPEIRSLATSPLRHGIRAGTNLMLQDHSDVSAYTEAKTKETLNSYAKQKLRMDRWVIAEDSITIRCRIYVISIIIGAVLIVCGAMAVPFCVGNDIRGVDPFQITSFTWLFVAFLVLLAKSRYVNQWPWHEFLRGQIVCSSIREVQDVSGIDPQIILLYLLHAERQNILKTRGPYNGMFFQRKDAGKFSIDVPTKLSTMLASGFIVLKVVNEDGEHLICIDVRKGATAQPVRNGVVEKYLAYLHLEEDLVESSDEEDTKDAVTVRNSTKSKSKVDEQPLLLFIHEFRWNKIVGFYIRDVKFG